MTIHRLRKSRLPSDYDFVENSRNLSSRSNTSAKAGATWLGIALLTGIHVAPVHKNTGWTHVPIQLSLTVSPVESQGM